MLSLNIRNLIIARGVAPHKVRAYLRDLGFEDSIAKSFASGKRKSLTTFQVEKLCYYLKVEPSELFIWSPDKIHKLVEGHPLNRIKAGNPLPDIIADSQSLPLQDLHKVHDYIEQLKNKDKK